MASVSSVATSLPPNRMRQSQLREVAEMTLPDSPGKAAILEVFDNARIEERALAMPVEWYQEPHGYKDPNQAYLEVGLELVEEAARVALQEAGLAPAQVGGIVMVSTTGLATPSLDARLVNLLGMPSGVVRLPVWGLGCAGGVAGLNRGAELAGAIGKPVLVLALELCTLSFDVQRALSGGRSGAEKKALVAAAHFADGCAAAVLAPGGKGPLHVAGASHLFPDTERVMGWDVEDHNLDVVLSPRIPDIVRSEMRSVLQPFLDRHLQGQAPDHWVLHPGGAKVIDAYRDALGLANGELRHTERALLRHGNMSSPTVLFALRSAMEEGLRPGQSAVLGALGPGFASELALLRGA
jgi:alkylresorcinol/alkylpyrone synthase